MHQIRAVSCFYLLGISLSMTARPTAEQLFLSKETFFSNEIIQSLGYSVVDTIHPVSIGLKSSNPGTPRGAAYEAVVVSYLQNDVDALVLKFPAYEKAYPTHLHTVFFKAWIADQTGQDKDAALRSYSEIIKKAPEFVDAYVWRSKAFWNKGLDDRAIADISKAIDMLGADATAQPYSLRGDYYYSAGDYAASMSDFNKAIQLAPALATNYIGLMHVSFTAGNPGEAEKILTAAIKGAQKNNAAIHFVYADFLLRSQRFSASDEAFAKAFSLAGSQPSGADYNNAAIAAYKLKAYERAALLSEKAISLSPRKIDFLFNRANISIDQQRWEEVYQWAQKALAIDSNSAYANMLMAIGVKRTGRGDALSAEYEEKAKRLSKAGN